MKNTTRLMLFVAFAVIAFSSCEKRNHEAITKVINVSLMPNQAYSYQVPAGHDADDMLQITQQATHFSNSTLSVTDKNTGALFQYTPAKDYAGTDEIHIATNENHPASADHHNSGHQCNGHHNEGTTYIFKITIGSATLPG